MYKIIENFNTEKTQKRLVLFCVSLVVCFGAVYINLCLGINIVYTHLFYLPILIAGIWFYKKVLFLGAFFGFLHIILDFIEKGQVFPDVLLRIAVIMLFSATLRYLSGLIAMREGQISIERQTLANLVKSIGDGVIAVDLDMKITEINEVAERIIGWTHEESIGRHLSDVFLLSHECEEYEVDNPVEEVLRTGEVCYMSNHAVLTNREGRRINVEDSASPIKNLFGEITGVVIVFRDVTERKAQRDRIKFVSHHDILTGLYNRRFMEEIIEQIDKECNYPLTIAMGDLNNLKLINDAFGHLEGDKAIKAFGSIISQNVRDEDLVVRWGGDEFLILMPSTTPGEASVVINRIENDCSRKAMPNGYLSVSFGISTKNSECGGIWEIFKRAEDKMYRKKLNESPSVRSKTIRMAMNTLFEKSPREKGHSERVSQMSVLIGKYMDLDAFTIDNLKTAGLLHDVGKIIISDQILDKAGRLNDSEWIDMKRHPVVGYRIINTVAEMRDLAMVILCHHERWDGKGYPKGLKSKEIPLEARIIAVADAYDAMVSDRSYKDAISEDDASDEIIRCAGTQFDPNVAKAFIEGVLDRNFEVRKDA